MDIIDKALNDALIHKNQAEKEIIKWKIILEERTRHLSTLEHLKDDFKFDNPKSE